VSAGDDACRVCCSSQSDGEGCTPFGSTMMTLSDGVPCEVDGRCENVSLYCVCMCIYTLCVTCGYVVL